MLLSAYCGLTGYKYMWACVDDGVAGLTLGAFESGYAEDDGYDDDDCEDGDDDGTTGRTDKKERESSYVVGGTEGERLSG